MEAAAGTGRPGRGNLKATRVTFSEALRLAAAATEPSTELTQYPLSQPRQPGPQHYVTIMIRPCGSVKGQIRVKLAAACRLRQTTPSRVPRTIRLR